MESTRPIRALMRGLDALTVLNLRDGATVSEVAHEIRLPRTTVYRILETLCNAGFVFRDESDDRYRLTIMVRALSGGFDDEAWVTQIAKPLIHELCRGHRMAGLDRDPLGRRDDRARNHRPLEPARHRALFRRLSRADADERRGSRVPRVLSGAAARHAHRHPGALHQGRGRTCAAAADTDLQRMLAEIRAQGYAVTSSTRRSVEEVSLSVPILLNERVLACL